MFFNNPEDCLSAISLQNSTINKDSTTVTLTNDSKENITISSSFLPFNTIAYNPNQNIISSTLLKPYVKGVIQDPQYYFNSSAENKSQDLDLLLLTQGWSKYSWEGIFNKPPNTNFSFEQGITIRGAFNKKLKRDQSVLIFSYDNKILKEISNENSFVFENSFIKKGSTIDFALKTDVSLIKIAPTLSYSKSHSNESIDINRFPTTNNYLLNPPDFKDLARDIEVLDEVLLFGKINKTKGANKNVYGAETMLRRKKMDERLIVAGETVPDFLKTEGFLVKDYGGELEIYSRSTRSNTSYSRSEELAQDYGGELEIYSRSTRSNTPYSRSEERDEVSTGSKVRVFLDDFEISESKWMIQNLFLDAVKEIYYGRNYDNRSGEHIYIYTLSPLEYLSKKAEYHSVEIPFGFSAEKEYYAPKYPSFFDELYLQYGAIFWESNLTIPAKSSIEIKVPVNLQEKMKVFIEGISESGKLISIQNNFKLAYSD